MASETKTEEEKEEEKVFVSTKVPKARVRCFSHKSYDTW